MPTKAGNQAHTYHQSKNTKYQSYIRKNKHKMTSHTVKFRTCIIETHGFLHESDRHVLKKIAQLMSIKRSTHLSVEVGNIIRHFVALLLKGNCDMISSCYNFLI